MKKISVVLAALAFSLMVVMASAESSTVKGYVSDTQCGAKGASESHAACMTKCLAKGAKVAIVTDGDNKVLTVDNPEVLKGHEGHHISATGTVTGESIHVDNIKML
ncbi:MAG TPA: hypothetical protein VKV04_09585 [Verrucomicrobiae bacterium]|nr:hypothetical protein [Verrucomicrobiae bacterium]